jgi:hypothetical protein
MIVYIESNFILEIALRQEQYGQAEEILKLAEQKNIELVSPSFSISEPFSTVNYRSVERKKLANLINQELVQIRRSELHKGVTSAIESSSVEIADLVSKEVNILQDTVKRILDLKTLIEINNEIFVEALNYQNIYDLSPQDSIIYSSIIFDLKKRDNGINKVFVSRNSKDFLLDDIQDELATYNCKFLPRFDSCISYIKSKI